MIVVPIIAAAGYKIPKTSSRSITSPAGTSDTVEVLAPVSLNLNKFKEVVKKTNGALVWGGGQKLAAADDKLIRIRHPLSLDPEGMILSSIIAKKYAVSATHLLVDIPVGKGAKVESKKDAKKLKKHFLKICKKLGIKTRVVISEGSSPIGKGIGPLLESKDVLQTLMNHPDASADLREKSLRICAEIFELVGRAKGRKAYRLAKFYLDSGKAYDKFKEILLEQGGEEKMMNPENLILGKYKKEIRAHKSGVIKYCLLYTSDAADRRG